MSRERDVFEDPDVKDYLDQLWARLPSYARRSAAVPPGDPSSIEWMGRVGKFWWELREQHNLSRYQVADLMGAHINEVRFFEFGLAMPEVALSDFPKSYAEALGKPELYEEFREKFNLLPVVSPQP